MGCYRPIITGSGG